MIKWKEEVNKHIADLPDQVDFFDVEIEITDENGMRIARTISWDKVEVEEDNEEERSEEHR